MFRGIEVHAFMTFACGSVPGPSVDVAGEEGGGDPAENAEQAE